MRLAVVFAAFSLLVGLALRALIKRRRRPRLALGALVLATIPAAALVSLRALSWLPGPAAPVPLTPLRAGVSYQRLAVQVPQPLVVHILRIALDTPGLRLATTRPADRTRPLPYAAQTTSAFVEETHAFAAVNGDFFDPWVPGFLFGYPKPGDPVRTLGLTYVAGEVVTPRGKVGAHLAVGPLAYAGFDDLPQPGGDLLSGLCMLVERGEPSDLAPCRAKQPYRRHPRSAIALDAQRETLLLVVVDGRMARYSEGAELGELAGILVDQGAYAAMSVDGGGSSSLVARNQSGEVELLNLPIADRIPGRERPIANQLGVYFDP